MQDTYTTEKEQSLGTGQMVVGESNLQTVELFAGTKSFSNIASKLGHKTYTIDNDNQFDVDSHADILSIYTSILPKGVDILWASPHAKASPLRQLEKTGTITIPQRQRAQENQLHWWKKHCQLLKT